MTLDSKTNGQGRGGTLSSAEEEEVSALRSSSSGASVLVMEVLLAPSLKRFEVLLLREDVFIARLHSFSLKGKKKGKTYLLSR